MSLLVQLCLLVSLNVTGSAPRQDAGPVDTRAVVGRLQGRVAARALVFVNPERDAQQLRALCTPADPEPQAEAQGAGPAPTPPCLTAGLIDLLDRLSALSTAEQPLVVLSLYRPAPGRPRETHARGLAADIAAYAGHRIASKDPVESLEAVLALLHDLPAGRYRLGLPMPLTAAPVPLLPPPPRPADWPFFPPPLVRLLDGAGVVAPRMAGGRPVVDRKGAMAPDIIRWAGGRYAAAEDLGSPRLRAALQQARLRGADVHSLFPDGRDHVHVDLQPEP